MNAPNNGPIGLDTRASQELTGGGLQPGHCQLAHATHHNLKVNVCHCKTMGNEQLLTSRLEETDHPVLVRVGP